MFRFIVLVFFVFVSEGFSETWYVDAVHGSSSNDGTSASGAFLKIGEGVNVAQAGDTVLVFSGEYNEKVSFPRSGSVGNWITLLAEDSTVVIDGTNLTPVDLEGLISVVDQSYIRVNGFEVRNFSIGAGDPTPVGILVLGTGDSIEILNNKVHNIQNTQSSSNDAGAHGIAVFGTKNPGISGLVVHGNEVYDNVLMWSEAVVINGNVSGFEVSNNYVHDNNNIGIDFIGWEDECSGCANDYVRNGVIRENRVENCSSVYNPAYGGSVSSGGGDPSAGGFYVDGGADLLFERNVSKGNDLGFEFASEHVGKASHDIIMRNNLVVENGQVGVTLGGYNQSSTGSTDHVTIIHNTFYKNHGWGSEIVFQYRVTDSRILNNIFYADGVAAYDVGKQLSNNTWEGNLYWNNGGSSDPGEAVNADPLFMNEGTGDFRLSSTSPAIDQGFIYSADTAGTTDFSGNTRIWGTNPDLGAYEYSEASTSVFKQFHAIQFKRKNVGSFDLLGRSVSKEIQNLTSPNLFFVSPKN